ncbi:hypothetical protein FH972_017666 [Carpinus fangiana]|uniref:Uncharacterized protein n=1 Tax=Carpinus fangiana TaxID=176857 RepID=A0A5N6RN46_9ROSI|nr:hypothetical protein FH972_017666 [Carpinus fangiana]
MQMAEEMVAAEIGADGDLAEEQVVMRRTAGAEASSPDNVESGRHNGNGALG